MYDEYVQLLTHSASDYDNIQIKVKGKRQVYLHEINEDTLDTYEDVASDYEPFGIDTPVETIQAVLRTIALQQIEAIKITAFECLKIGG
jgi:hypothetical protein